MHIEGHDRSPRRWRPLLLLMVAGAMATGVLLGLILSSGLDLPEAGRAQLMAEASGEPAAPIGTSLASPFVAVARQVVPAVVYVDATRRMDQSAMPNDRIHGELFRRLFPPAKGARSARRWSSPSSGSGFIIDAEGYILTTTTSSPGPPRSPCTSPTGATTPGS